MFGAIDDEELDFNPAAGSKLASLFGLERSPEKGNASLTYTAPKQPKHHSTDDSMSSKKSTPASTSTSTNKLSIVLVKAVTSFKLEDGKYNPQGKLGLALLGNSSTRLFQLLLYKGKQQQITTVRITPHFQFTVQPHLYASFYDDRTQNWSIMFENNEDAVEFTTQVAIARYRSASLGEELLLSQELLPGNGDCFKENETVELKLAAQPFKVDSVQVVDFRQYTIHCTLSHRLVNSGWAAGLCGAGTGSLRVILVPLNVSLPWLTSQRNEPLLVEAKISSMKIAEDKILKEAILSEEKESKNSAPASGADSAVDSGAEDGTVRARGASIKEALTNSPRSNKASIISRMARMGQATLPLKGAIPCNPSDSEETEEDFGSHGSSKSPLKTRPAKSRSGSSALRQQPVPSTSSTSSSVVSGVISPSTVSVAPSHWHQQQNVIRSGPDGSVFQILSPDGQLVSLSSQQQLPLVASANAIVSPSDPTPHMSMFLSEARLQNTEMRMHLSKFSDKMDQLLTKVDNLQVSSGPPPPTSTAGIGLEPNMLLSSIEKLVKDNQLLQTEVAEKNKRLDEQNERIFSLLNTNSKFLEQSSSLLEQKQLQEQKQQNQEQQQKKQEEQLQLIQQMREEKTSFGNQLGSLQNQLVTVQELVQALQKSNNELNQELEATRGRLQEKEKNFHDVDLQKQKLEIEDQLLDLKKSLGMEKSENCRLQEQIVHERSKSDAVKSITEDQCKKLEEQLKIEVTELKDQLYKQDKDYKKIVSTLEEKCKELDRKLQLQPKQTEVNLSPSEHLINDVKILMNTLHKGLNHQFTLGQSYDGSEIRKIISSLVKREALHFVSKLEGEKKSLLEQVPLKPDVSATDKDLSVSKKIVVAEDYNKKQSVESLEETTEKSTSMPTNFIANTGITGQPHIEPQSEVKKDQDSSYESSWRPLPPPPPIFHDEDDSDDWLS